MADDGRHAGEAGTATAELAVSMPAVAMALVAVLGVGQVVIAQVSCADAARAAARAGARGEPLAVVRALAQNGVDDATVALTRQGPLLTVSVTRTVRLLLARGPAVRLRGSAVAFAEQRPALDRGSATILALAIVLVAGFLATATTGLATAVLARHRAQAAADLGALAGADVLLGRAPGPACEAAAQVVRANGAALRGCEVRGLDVLVSTLVRPPAPVGQLGAARARARAGPGPP